MTELERSLTALAAELDWPPTPEALAGRVAARLAPHRRGRRRRGLVLALALAAALAVVVGIAFAVPPARTAILRFFGLGRVRIERIETLPPAQERPLTAGLGRRETLAEAARELGFRPLVPARIETVYVRDGYLSYVVAAPGPVLVSELPASGPVFVKKLAQPGTTAVPVTVDGAFGLWIAGAEHVVYLPSLPPRYARDVLVWQHGRLTLRLEGDLTKEQALRLARALESS